MSSQRKLVGRRRRVLGRLHLGQAECFVTSCLPQAPSSWCLVGMARPLGRGGAMLQPNGSRLSCGAAARNWSNVRDGGPRRQLQTLVRRLTIRDFCPPVPVAESSRRPTVGLKNRA
jgi:hypothetical protein